MSNFNLIHGSCANQTTDAVVNAANSGLWQKAESAKLSSTNAECRNLQQLAKIFQLL